MPTTTRATPGPWVIEDMRDCAKPHIAIRPAGRGHFLASLSADTFTYGASGESIEANARLIAAAPDLLASLKECSFRLATLVLAAGDLSEINASALDAANAAIAKAEA